MVFHNVALGGRLGDALIAIVLIRKRIERPNVLADSFIRKRQSDYMGDLLSMCNNYYKSVRQRWIDILRGIGILMVVLGHSGPPFFKIIYGFHIPLFFLISGYLLSDKKLKMSFISYMKMLMKAYLRPYFLLCGINLIFQSVILYKKREFYLGIIGKYIIGILYSRGSSEWLPNCSPLWFMTALFVSLSLYYWINKCGKYTVLYVLIAGIMSYVLDILNVSKLPWNVDTAMMGIVFIYIGRNLKMINEIKCESNLSSWIFILLLLIVGRQCIIMNPIGAVSFDNNQYGNLIMMIFGALSICIALFLFCYTYRNKMKNLLWRFVEYLGRHTIFIMGFDYLSGTLAAIILTRLNLMHWFLMFIVKIFVLLIGLQGWNLFIDIIQSQFGREEGDIRRSRWY